MRRWKTKAEKWKVVLEGGVTFFSVRTENGLVVSMAISKQKGMLDEIVKYHNIDHDTQAKRIEELEAEVKDDIEIIHDATAKVIVLEGQVGELVEVLNYVVRTYLCSTKDNLISNSRILRYQQLLNKIKEDQNEKKTDKID